MPAKLATSGRSGEPSAEAPTLPRVRLRARAYWRALRVNLPFAWMYAFNLIVWMALFRREKACYGRHDLPEIDPLADSWESIRLEVLELLPERDSIPTFQELDPGQSRLTYDDRWRIFALRFYGRDVAANRRRCPSTAAVVDSVPGVHTAMFSIVEPGKITPWHLGPYKGVVRCLLPLVVPGGGTCGLRVLGGGTQHLREGVPVVFDDTYPHKAWNTGDDVRVVLFLDIIRTFPWRWLNELNRRCLDLLVRTRRVDDVVRRAATEVVHDEPLVAEPE